MELNKKKYRITQKVTIGPKYTEHSYRAYSSNFIGKWQRYGGMIDANISSDPILCEYCVLDYYQRHKTRQSSQLPESSYQVAGYTYPTDKWDWSLNICRNKQNCWGKSERLFQMKRKRDKYQMTHIKVLPGMNEQINDRQYFELTRISHYPNRYTGTINRIGSPSFFWPDLFKGQPEHDSYIFHVDNQTNYPLPEHIKGKPFSTLPKVYQKPEYKYVNSFTFNIFRKNEHFPWPTKLYESRTNHHPVAITTLNLYPGGAGFECKQYKYLTNREFDKSVKCTSEMMAWTEKEYIFPFEAFIPFKQDGFSGPITSYYHRINCDNPFFS